MEGSSVPAKGSKKLTRPGGLLFDECDRAFIESHTIGFDVDHLNGNLLDCRRENLRIVPHSINAQNHTRNRRNASGFRGVSFHKLTNRWRARAFLSGRETSLGEFDDILDAAQAVHKWRLANMPGYVAQHFESEWLRHAGVPYPAREDGSVRSADILPGAFYIATGGVTFLAGDIITTDGKTMIDWEVVRVGNAQTYHRVGNRGEWELRVFAGRMQKLWIRRCRFCRCVDERACPEGCTWIDIDVCSACEDRAAKRTAKLAAKRPRKAAA
ncbi:MAG: HNH endonuclease [Vulcanimicrobiaceae bacterium]|jgi:hypothetical protein